MMKRSVPIAVAMVLAAALVAPAQVGDVNKILADARAALGGDKKLDAVKTLAMTGRTLRTAPSGLTMEGDFEATIALPDKFVRRDMVANLGNMSIYRMSGFNGDGVINEMDQPPQLAGGGNIIIHQRVGSGGTFTSSGGAPPTPEEQEAIRKATIVTAKQDFTRLTLGIFAGSFPSYPLTMTYAGQAESPDGKADIVEVKGEGDFAAKLFIDATSHLPLMLSWMAKEPLQITNRQVGGPGGGTVVIKGGGMDLTKSGGTSQAPPAKMTPEEREKMAKDFEAQAREADSKRRIVEYRLFYADYRSVDGVMVPFRLQRSVDGKPTEEITFEKVKVNGKIDEKIFTVSK